MPQQTYEIRVRGRLGETFRTAFPCLRACTQGNDTVLSGSLVDHAALYGVLAMIETLGLELVELRQVTSPTSRPASPPTELSLCVLTVSPSSPRGAAGSCYAMSTAAAGAPGGPHQPVVNRDPLLAGVKVLHE